MGQHDWKSDREIGIHEIKNLKQSKLHRNMLPAAQGKLRLDGKAEILLNRDLEIRIGKANES